MTPAMISLLVVIVLILGFISASEHTKDMPDKAELAHLRSKEQESQRLTDDLQEEVWRDRKTTY